jgi:hypothetical protein
MTKRLIIFSAVVVYIVGCTYFSYAGIHEHFSYSSGPELIALTLAIVWLYGVVPGALLLVMCRLLFGGIYWVFKGRWP